MGSTTVLYRLSSFATAFFKNITCIYENYGHLLKIYYANLHQHGAEASIVGAKKALCSTTTSRLYVLCSPNTTENGSSMRNARKKSTLP
jgi:hypothetical protein